MTIVYKDGGKLTCHNIFLDGDGYINADDLYVISIEEVDYITDEEDEQE